MSFFKDFKSDISQAMNELMPDGNEVLENETPKTKKKSMNPLSKNLNADLGLDDKALEDVDIPDLDDIAPEDMLDHIDDLIDGELYGNDKTPELLLDDDMEVNTMDMSVDDLLNQLSEKQSQNITDGAYDGASIEEQEAVEDREEIVNDELNADLLIDIIADENNDKALEDVKDNNSELSDSESSESDLDALLAEESFSDEMDNADTENNNTEQDDTNTITDQDDSNSTTENLFKDQETTESDIVNNDANDSEQDDISAVKDINDVTINEDISVSDNESNDGITEDVNDKQLTNDEEVSVLSDNVVELKEEDSVEDKDVISINSTEEKNDNSSKNVSKATSEKSFNVNAADTETTYITKGTNIKGDIDTDGSIDIIGSVDGNVTCQGKVVVGGIVKGNITAGELYANGARIEGDVKSYGSVKVGVGSMIIGGIEGESAVIAGAVNGEIDVKGPVIVDSTAVIMGNIKSRSVQINNGAVIEGFCSQSYSDIDVKSFFA